MDKEILKQLFKPICIHEYSDEYYVTLINVIKTACNENSFEWFIKCLKVYALGEFDDEFRLELINYLHSVNNDSTLEMNANNEAKLSVFAQAIVYECIFNCDDKVRASTLSLALNTLMFGVEKSLNHFYVTKMRSFFRESNINAIKKNRESKNGETNSESSDYINVENKVLKWILNLDRKKYPKLNDEQFALYLGKELAEKSSTNAIFNYPEAYIAKILDSSSTVKNNYSKKIEIGKIFRKLDNYVVSVSLNNVLFPLMSNTVKTNMKISLIDFAIEVYYEQMLLNLIKANNYAE